MGTPKERINPASQSKLHLAFSGGSDRISLYIGRRKDYRLGKLQRGEKNSRAHSLFFFQQMVSIKNVLRPYK
jgi:hypothetical protein